MIIHVMYNVVFVNLHIIGVNRNNILHTTNSQNCLYCYFHNSAESQFHALGAKLRFGFHQSNQFTNIAGKIDSSPPESELEFLFSPQLEYRYGIFFEVLQ